jgi:hypothetical protein
MFMFLNMNVLFLYNSLTNLVGFNFVKPCFLWRQLELHNVLSAFLLEKEGRGNERLDYEGT